MGILKNKLTVILASLLVLFFVGTIFSCMRASRLDSVRGKEMAGRLDAEEKLDKLTHEKAGLEEKLNKATRELAEANTALATAKKVLLQEQLVNESLKDELQKVNKSKVALEEQLKAVTATDMKSKK